MDFLQYNSHFTIHIRRIRIPIKTRNSKLKASIEMPTFETIAHKVNEAFPRSEK